MILSFSLEGFATKPQNAGAIKYTEREVNFDELKNYITSGHTISANFNTKGTVFTQWERKSDNFKSIPFVFYDVDHGCNIELNDLIESMSIKPTVAYTTFSHQKVNKEGVKENRYRLLYFFDKPISDIKIYKYFSNQIKLSFSDTISDIDNCSKNPAQAIYGTSRECIYIYTNNILSYDFYIKDYTEISGQYDIIEKRSKSNIQSYCPVSETDNPFLQDYFSGEYKQEELLSKYSSVYEYFDRTPIPEGNEDNPINILPDNYIEIKRYLCKEPIYDENGKVRSYNIKPVKLKDGDGRKNKLFTATLLRKYMKPDIDIPYLLYCALYDLCYFCYNFEDHITDKKLYQLVVDAYSRNPYDELIAKSRVKKKYVANPVYCEKEGCRKMDAVYTHRHQKKLDKYAEIGNLYDVEATYEENLATMLECGLKVSLKDIQRFRIENNLPSPPRKRRSDAGSTKPTAKRPRKAKKEETFVSLYTPINEQNTIYALPFIIEVKPGSAERLKADFEDYMRNDLCSTGMTLFSA